MWNTTGSHEWISGGNTTSLTRYLVVAAGGSSNGLGGAGAGGYQAGTNLTVNGSIQVIVGGPVFRSKGQNSSFSSILALGGGAYPTDTGVASGAGGDYVYTTGGLGTAGQGNNGGGGTGAPNYPSGGGGGFGSVGGSYSGSASGAGGSGISNDITGVNINYACGGGGTATTQGATYGAAGCDTAGDGAHTDRGIAGNGTPNSGSGSGGYHIGTEGYGGSGIVVIEYPHYTITANYTISNVTGTAPSIVQFTDTSTTTAATIDSWSWDFGDGNISSSQNPTHTYEIPGTYSANLTITNTSLSLVSTKLSNITVYRLPDADFSAWNTAGNAPHTTYLYDTSTNLNPGPYTYYWDFGDGNTSTEQNTYFTWNITGTYDINHCITDSVTTACNNRTAYVTVGTAVVAPVASFYGGPQLGAPPLQVFFTDVSTNTPTGWNWSHGDGTYSIIQNPTHWYNKSGFYTVGLTASNGAGSNTSTQTNFVMVY